MNQGKRWIRNTVLVLYGAAAAWVGVNRLSASMLDEDTLPGVKLLLTLGLERAEQEERPGASPGLDLATVRDFTELSVFGRFDVEIVGAPDYKVTFVPVDGGEGRAWAQLSEGQLRITSVPSEPGDPLGRLRIEVPTLASITAATHSLQLSGLRAPLLRLRGLGRVDEVRLVDNEVGEWQVVSGAPLLLLVDDLTFAAGSFSFRGNVSMRREN